MIIISIIIAILGACFIMRFLPQIIQLIFWLVVFGGGFLILSGLGATL